MSDVPEPKLTPAHQAMLDQLREEIRRGMKFLNDAEEKEPFVAFVGIGVTAGGTIQSAFFPSGNRHILAGAMAQFQHRLLTMVEQQAQAEDLLRRQGTMN